MKNLSKIIKNPAITGALFALSIGWGATTASAQFSGGTYGNDQPDTKGFQLTAKPLDEETQEMRLTADFQFGAENVHRFIRALTLVNEVPFDGGDGPDYVKPVEFDGGDGPDYVKPVEFDGGDGPDYVKPVEFDGGDGPDYVKPVEFDGGDGPDYVKPVEFDGGDGPDYVKPVEFDGGDGPDFFNLLALVGSDAADSLVGSDAADSLVGSDAADSLVGSDAADSLVGSDAADSLVGSDAADSLVGSDAADSLRFDIIVEAGPAFTPLVQEMAGEIYELLDTMFSQIPVTIQGERASELLNNLVATGNELAIVDGFGVSLKADANEVAIVSARNASPESNWSEDLSVLLWDLEVGLMTTEQFGAEISNIISEMFLTNGIETQAVRFSIK